MRRIFTERMIFMLKYDEFKSRVIEGIKDYIPDKYRNYNVEVMRVNKINESLDAFCLVDKSRDVGSSPVVYFEDMYSYYRSCMNLDSTLKWAGGIITEGLDMAGKGSVSLGDIRDNTVLVLVNAEKNREMLKTVPHVRFLDLAFIFRWIVSINDHSFTGAIINSALNSFDLTTEELFELAKKNTRRLLPPVVRTLNSTLISAGASDDMLNGCELPVLVLSNRYGVEGAAAIVFEDVLGEIRKFFGDDFYIMPTSVNEVMLVPASLGRAEVFRDMVREINRRIVAEKDRLSDNLYLYNGEIRIV